MFGFPCKNDNEWTKADRRERLKGFACGLGFALLWLIGLVLLIVGLIRSY